ncbi:MAG: thioredoxin family protein [Paludibacteraceae bacterium]|nr:thioredoxin family protein [Paludibacteraceae bacterium]MBN2788078.1 thioredoxin family protein [Paludibacteraceae bacterium]
MKKIFSAILLLFLTLTLGLNAQIVDPVKWTFEQNAISKTEAELVFKAIIEKPYHMYGMDIPADGPIPTSVTFDEIKGATLVGDVFVHPSSKPVKEFDNTFNMELTWYKGEVLFIQKIKITDRKNLFISGNVNFMSCNDESCLPPKKVEFSFGKKEADVQPDSSASVGFIIEPLSITPASDEKNYWTPVIDQIKGLESEENSDESSSTSYWIIFLAGFIGGLLALFTPCVWPIIPMTVSFFLKRNKDKSKGRKEALFYGVSINVIYVALGILITLIFGASALNELSTNAVFNLLFVVLLVVFAISFFGFFEITLPSSWSNALNNKAESTTGIVSILLMAFTLVVVSFSCTGPIIGTLLVEVSTTGSLLGPTVGMFGFAFALSIPFSLFALFPTWLNAMPRSGSWMNNVKVVLAFFELAFALKFFSVADLSYGWGLLTRNVFITIWILIAIALGLYLLGIIRFPHDSKYQPINWFRRTLAIATFIFVAYLSGGYWGAPLKEISAFMPPQESKNVFHDYDEGMKFAAENQLPVFVDFTGYGCVNCRKMEAAVFTNPEVERLLSQFVVINLYVDHREPLAIPEKVQENGKPLLLETKGEKWSYLQRIKFGANAQPYYVLLDNEGNVLSNPYAYNEDVKAFTEYLQRALDKFNY